MQALVDVFTEDGHVILAVCPVDGRPVELDLEPDEARQLVNHLGAAILAASRASAWSNS
jgi:hypothetical protein